MKALNEVTEPSNADINAATEAVRDYIAALEDAVTVARCELTIASYYANLLSQPTTNRTAIVARVGYALTELGGPIEGKDNAQILRTP
jgi:hypothetical protein